MEGRKIKTRIQNCKTQEGEVWHFLTFSVCMYGYHKNSAKILNSHRKCWLIWSSSSLLRVFVLDSILPFNCSGPTSWALNITTSESHSSLTNVFRPFFRSRRFMWAQLFVWSSYQNRWRGSSGHSGAASKIRMIIPLATKFSKTNIIASTTEISQFDKLLR